MEKINIKDARIIAALKNSLPELYDGVFIMYHNKNTNHPQLIKPNKWTNFQATGEIADGVAIVAGGKILVIAPNESSPILWSNSALNAGGTNTDDRNIAFNDWNGRSSTLVQIKHAECEGINYAPGFCDKYGRTNINGQGLTAGKWWLPSLGEMTMIGANIDRVNDALSLINGASKLSESIYYTSTEYGIGYAWILKIIDGSAYGIKKNTDTAKVRPVSAFIV